MTDTPEDISDQDLEDRDKLAELIRKQQEKAAGAIAEIDKTYNDIVNWWRVNRPKFKEKADANGVEMGREDCVSIVMYAIANAHPATDLAMMLAAVIVEEVGF